MTYGQWPEQDGHQGVGRGAVPPQWRHERKDSTGLLGWYGPEPGNRQRAFVPQQAQRLFLPTRHPQERQRGFDPPSPRRPCEGLPQPPCRPEPSRPAQQPRGKSWPARQKALIGLLALIALVIIIGAANSGRSPSSPGRGTTAGLTATTSATTAPTPTTPAAVVAPPASPVPAICHPRTSTGKCYEPGEYCRVSDRDASGVTSDGEPITCEDNYGWRWEPS